MTQLTVSEKCELLKETIYQLYSKEGRSYSYIGKLLNINRRYISLKIREWNFPLPQPEKRLTPSKDKKLKKYKNSIISKLNNNVPITEICKEYSLSDYDMKLFFKIDEDLKNAKEHYIKRLNEIAEQNKMRKIKVFSKEYDFEDLECEIWKEILGFENYQVSNKGRIKSYKKTYDKFILIKATPNINNGRLYVSLYTSDGKRKNLMVARLVAHAFVSGYDAEIKNTVNHIDGNIKNNCSDNLEWISQSENNLHSYHKLNRKKVSVKYDRRYRFNYILYKDKYKFKTIEALARFIEKSPTQTRRYLDNPEKHDLKLM